MPVIKTTATTQLLTRKKKSQKDKSTSKSDAEKTRLKSIKKSISGKVKPS